MAETAVAKHVVVWKVVVVVVVVVAAAAAAAVAEGDCGDGEPLLR